MLGIVDFSLSSIIIICGQKYIFFSIIFFPEQEQSLLFVISGKYSYCLVSNLELNNLQHKMSSLTKRIKEARSGRRSTTNSNSNNDNNNNSSSSSSILTTNSNNINHHLHNHHHHISSNNNNTNNAANNSNLNVALLNDDSDPLEFTSSSHLPQQPSSGIGGIGLSTSTSTTSSSSTSSLSQVKIMANGKSSSTPSTGAGSGSSFFYQLKQQHECHDSNCQYFDEYGYSDMMDIGDEENFSIGGSGNGGHADLDMEVSGNGSGGNVLGGGSLNFDLLRRRHFMLPMDSNFRGCGSGAEKYIERVVHGDFFNKFDDLLDPEDFD